MDAEEEVEMEAEAQRSYKLERNVETVYVCVIRYIHPAVCDPNRS